MQKNSNKKNLGSYPYTGVVISITLALFVTGLFGLLIIYSQELERLVRENIKVQVYLKNGLTEAQRLHLEKTLQSMPYATKSTLEPSIHFISKDSAAKKFIADTGEDFLKFLGENPLHDAYLLNISPTYHSKEKLEAISKELEKINGVFQVFYVEGLIESINENITRIGVLLIGLIALLLITVVLLINNTLRLALFSQRFLIRSMQLVGARKWFIQKPFLARSVSYGALSGILASGLIWVLINYANKNIEDLTEIQNEKSIMLMMAMLLITGIIVAVISTFFSIKKYLNMSLDELY